jgi:uncharacterized protein YndB with AHSA1/START domain
MTSATGAHAATTEALTTQVYTVFIRTTPERLWEAITTPEFTRRYFHGASVTIRDNRLVSLSPADAVWMDEAVEEWDPPRRLVHGWHSGYDPDMAAEPASRVSWEIEQDEPGVCRLTVTHDRLDGAPKTAASVFGRGWMRVLSGLKTLLETGEPLSAAR